MPNCAPFFNRAPATTTLPSKPSSLNFGILLAPVDQVHFPKFKEEGFEGNVVVAGARLKKGAQFGIAARRNNQGVFAMRAHHKPSGLPAVGVTDSRAGGVVAFGCW